MQNAHGTSYYTCTRGRCIKNKWCMLYYFRDDNFNPCERLCADVWAERHRCPLRMSLLYSLSVRLLLVSESCVGG